MDRRIRCDAAQKAGVLVLRHSRSLISAWDPSNACILWGSLGFIKVVDADWHASGNEMLLNEWFNLRPISARQPTSDSRHVDRCPQFRCFDRNLS
ncbi:unnamed protein product [Tuwongella immobilis]|uniref:Uncharacterized protein n=1 Tax=Tuwongella immobilis TaxID=692036 RepID=A0A6C2YUS3_9BACT|nr:unnamed protein product [Tuwongella immobilis]VTS07638.1 unnamed protein product [Tuwongella immobilis]